MTTHTGEPDALGPEFLADPYRAYGRLREQAALVHGTFMGQVEVWYATRFAEANAVLDDPRFVNDPASVPGGDVPDLIGQLIQTYGFTAEEAAYQARTIISTDAPDHPRLRTLVSRAFTVRRVSELRPRVEAITAALLDELAVVPSAAAALLSWSSATPRGIWSSPGCRYGRARRWCRCW